MQLRCLSHSGPHFLSPTQQSAKIGVIFAPCKFKSTHLAERSVFSMETEELFMIIIVGGIFFAAAINGLYLFLLGRFFKEWQQKDPELWQAKGSPDFGRQITGNANFRSLFAVLGVLREKATAPGYPAAHLAWLMFRIAAAVTCLMFIGVGASVFYMETI